MGKGWEEREGKAYSGHVCEEKIFSIKEKCNPIFTDT